MICTYSSDVWRPNGFSIFSNMSSLHGCSEVQEVQDGYDAKIDQGSVKCKKQCSKLGPFSPSEPGLRGASEVDIHLLSLALIVC